MMTELEVTHHFDAAHRLPHLPGKCQSLHGHTWYVAARVRGEVGAGGLVVDFGLLKDRLRTFLDGAFDHGTLLGSADSLLKPLKAAGTKVFIFDGSRSPAQWPTVEAVAEVIGWHLTDVFVGTNVRTVEVRVRETVSNTAIWRPE